MSRRQRRESAHQRMVAELVRKRPVEAMVVGPVCGIGDLETQQADPILGHVLERWMHAFQNGDQEALELADGVIDYLGVVRQIAATVGRWS